MKRQKKRMIASLLFILVSAVICLAQDQTPVKKDISSQPLLEGFVYFTDADRVSLKSEKIRFPSDLDDHMMGREIVAVLIQGPSHGDLEPLWPDDVDLNAFFIADNGKAYVDFNIPQEVTQTMDARTELLAVYSLVNSLTLNIPKIKMVKILVQGKESQTLAGHVDIEYFYRTNMLIVK